MAVGGQRDIQFITYLKNAPVDLILSAQPGDGFTALTRTTTPENLLRGFSAVFLCEDIQFDPESIMCIFEQNVARNPIQKVRWRCVEGYESSCQVSACTVDTFFGAFFVVLCSCFRFIISSFAVVSNLKRIRSSSTWHDDDFYSRAQSCDL